MAQFQSTSVTGSLTVTGQVVAQTLNVQQVTSSIVYSSGSNIFGNSLANTQQFTGSVSVTGSLTAAGAGTFAGSVTAASLALSGTVASGGDAATLTIKQAGTTFTNGIYLERAGERNGYYMYIGGALDALTFRRNYFGTQSDVISLTRDGNVGIGVASPSEKLEVQDGYISTYHNVNADTAGYGVLFYTNGGGSKNNLATIVLSQVGTARTGNLIFATSNAGSPSEKMRITSDGYLRLTSNSGGIQFNGDTAAANALDDYEEGSFTPSSLGTDFSSISVTFGRYIKIGNQVTINCRWAVTPGSTGMKYVVFDLPFAFVDNINIAFTGAVSNYNEGQTAGSSNVGTTTRNSSSSTTQQYVQAYYTSTNVSTLLLSMTYFTFY